VTTIRVLARTRITRLIAIAMALSLVPAHGAATRARLRLAITVKEGEHSRDSNSSATTITLTGNRIHYAKGYQGYRSGRRQAVDRNVYIRDQDLDLIQKLLRENELLRSRSSISPTNQPGSYVEIEATIALHNKRSVLRFAGMRDRADSDTLCTGLLALLDEIKKLVNR